MRQSAVGVNYIDVYDRTGLYPVSAAERARARGRRHHHRSRPRRARPAQGRTRRLRALIPGRVCELRNVPAERLVKVPAGVSDEQAAALMLKGLTAQFLLRRTYRVPRGDTLLVHAAAGGVGLILCQWAKALGAKVIGVVGSEAKAELATQARLPARADLPGAMNWSPGVKALTEGAGVAAVYDAVGKDTFMESLDCVRRLGMMVSYGNASGPPPAISPLELTKRGSLFLTRPSLFNYIATREELAAGARELFAAVHASRVRVVIGQRYPLARAADAHRDLEGRRTTGSTVLLP